MKKNPYVGPRPLLTKKEEHQIRRFLLTGMNGWEYPLEENHEKQEKGWYPFYSTVHMAERAMQDLLKLKAEIAKLHAEKAEKYYSQYLPDN